MSTLEANMAMLATFSEEKQQEIYTYLVMQCGNNNPFKPVGREEIFAELEESRSCFERGEYKDFGEAIDEIRIKYGYRKQHFEKHRYLMIYRIYDNMAVVEGMYHELQDDYEALFVREKNK